LHRFQSSNYFSTEQQQIGPYNAGGMCLLRSTLCVFKLNSDLFCLLMVNKEHDITPKFTCVDEEGNFQTFS
jgi:hypothetical protein